MDDVWDRLADAQWHHHEAVLRGDTRMEVAWRRRINDLTRQTERDR